MVKIIAAGIVGINIEDRDEVNPQLLDESEFSERITAIRDLSDSLGFHLVINARTDAFLVGSGEPENRLAAAIMRGNKYRRAGADCIFIPGVWQEDMIAALVRGIDAPINILINPTGGFGMPPSVKVMEDLGVARVSFGSSMAKATLSLTKKIADELIVKGTLNTLFDSLTPVNETIMAYKMAVGLQ